MPAENNAKIKKRSYARAYAAGTIMFYRIVIAKKAQKEFKKIKTSNPNIADKIKIL